MRLLSATVFLTLAAVAFAADGGAAAGARIRSTFPSGNGTLHAQLFKPDGDGPFPTVIALHGCGGLARPFRTGPAALSRLGGAIAEGPGNAVLLPDSYGSRELGPQCRVKERHVLRPPRTGGRHHGGRGNG